MLGYVFPTGEVRGEKERERESTREQMARPPLPKPLGSIYRGGEDDCLHFILLMG
jgi:hypothetical protein